jgi:hypothetical protein
MSKPPRGIIAVTPTGRAARRLWIPTRANAGKRWHGTRTYRTHGARWMPVSGLPHLRRFVPDWLRAQRPCLENPNMVTHGLRLARVDTVRLPAR